MKSRAAAIAAERTSIRSRNGPRASRRPGARRSRSGRRSRREIAPRGNRSAIGRPGSRLAIDRQESRSGTDQRGSRSAIGLRDVTIRIRLATAVRRAADVLRGVKKGSAGRRAAPADREPGLAADGADRQVLVGQAECRADGRQAGDSGLARQADARLEGRAAAVLPARADADLAAAGRAVAPAVAEGDLVEAVVAPEAAEDRAAVVGDRAADVVRAEGADKAAADADRDDRARRPLPSQA